MKHVETLENYCAFFVQNKTKKLNCWNRKGPKALLRLFFHIVVVCYQFLELSKDFWIC